MSQLATALQTLEREHTHFLNKATTFHALTDADRATTESSKVLAQDAQAGAEGAETTTNSHEAAALASRNSARTAALSGWQAVRDSEAQVTRAKQAAVRAEAMQAGEVDQFTQWLLDSPVNQGTMHLTFGEVRPDDQPSLTLDFQNQVYQVWETDTHYRVYE